MGNCAGQGAGIGLRHELARARAGLVAALLLGLTAAGCTTNGQPPLASATLRGPTVAFESIDGPPESVFHKLVQTLSEEAEARQLAVVSREGPAQYRVRGYVSAQTQGKRTTVAWVWDVYDGDQRRAIRISGEEPASTAGRGTWAVADDLVLRRIAYAGMDRLVAFLASPDAQPDAPVPGDRKPAAAVAARGDDVAPAASGMAADQPEAGTRVLASSEPVPLPNRRPAGAGFASPDSLAYLGPTR
jgi:hypothetical protein